VQFVLTSFERATLAACRVVWNMLNKLIGPIAVTLYLNLNFGLFVSSQMQLLFFSVNQTV
jgi:hypothetical protein